MFKSINFEVVGDQRIVCEGCEQRIEKMLKSVQGVDKARAHIRNQRIEVLFDAAVVDTSAIVGVLAKAGYETKVAS